MLTHAWTISLEVAQYVYHLLHRLLSRVDIAIYQYHPSFLIERTCFRDLHRSQAFAA